MNSSRSNLAVLDGAGNTVWAWARCPRAPEIILAITASTMVGAETPRSKATWLVHFPVPFCPAASQMSSTKGVPVSASTLPIILAVISIR